MNNGATSAWRTRGKLPASKTPTIGKIPPRCNTATVTRLFPKRLVSRVICLLDHSPNGPRKSSTDWASTIYMRAICPNTLFGHRSSCPQPRSDFADRQQEFGGGRQANYLLGCGLP